MTTKLSNTRLAAMAAFGMTSLGALSFAAAHPDDKPLPAPQSNIYGTAVDDAYGYDDAVPSSHYDDVADYDTDDDGVLDHVEIDYRRYDNDRDGTLGPSERTAYWAHIFDMGRLGTDLTRADKLRLARIAYVFDRDADGRLTGTERAGLTRLVRARRDFLSLDRNRDNTITPREIRGGWGAYRGDRYNRRTLEGRSAPGTWSSFYWSPYGGRGFGSRNWIARRFDSLDRNTNGKVTWNEVETHIVRAFRFGVRR
jgi:hypothetical protein